MCGYDLSTPDGRERWQAELAKANTGDRKARLAVIRARLARATPGPWYWNSYDQIGAEVPEGHPLDYAPEDPTLNVSGKKIAFIAWIDGGPRQRGKGDELHEPEARANADLISEAPSDLAWLLDKVDQLETALAFYADHRHWAMRLLYHVHFQQGRPGEGWDVAEEGLGIKPSPPPDDR